VSGRKVAISSINQSDKWLSYTLFGALLLLEFLFFRGYAEREVVWAYPNNHDQAAYLFHTYDLYTDHLSNGVGAWIRYLKTPSPHGILFPVQGLFLRLLFGATRMACLGVNFICFVVLQAFLLHTVRWLTQNVWLGFVGVGLLLSQVSAFFWAGGLFDYRIDFSAYCLYGIWILVVLRSEVFSNTMWTVIAALVAAWLMLTRFVTVPYVIGATLLTALLISLTPLCTFLNARERRAILRRITGAGLFLAIAAAITAPFLYLARHVIWEYYGGRHLGPEKYIIDSELQITDFVARLSLYPNSIWYDHLGSLFVALSLALLCIAYIFRRVSSNNPADGSSHSDSSSRIPAFLFVVTTIVTPLIVLTMNPTKSRVVGDIVGVPVALITLLAVLRIVGGANLCAYRTFLSSGACVTLAAISMAVGVWNYLSHLTSHGPFHNRRVEVAHLMTAYDSIGQYVERAGLNRKPSISFNMINDAMFAKAISAVQFERRRALIHMETLLGHSILAVDRGAVFKRLEQTDILFLGDTSKRFGLNEHYPFNNTVTPLSGEIEQWARRELVSLVSFPSVEGRGYSLYVRPAMRISGLTRGNYIPAEGFWLTGDSRVILQRPICIVEGALDKTKKTVASLTADLYQNNTFPSPVPVDLEQDGDKFRITLDFRKVAIRDEGEVAVTLRPVSQSGSEKEHTYSEQQTTCLCRPGHIRMERAFEGTGKTSQGGN
jgi:hypothetical protein